MSLPIALRPEAEQDLAEARDWYEARLAGLGIDFLLAADEFFQRIAMFPEIYAIVVKNVRCGKLRRFPYLVYYRALADKIEVLAVWHGSRHPRVWRARIKSPP
jgi:plasmid stabilization system protein ParE